MEHFHCWHTMIIPLAFVVSGCGSGVDVERIPVSGSVTYLGQPVKLGTIIFEPTAAAGLTAKAAYLPVNDGEFTSGANGPTSGEFVVRISGYDKSKMKNPNSEIEDIPLLFPEYTMTVQIPVPGNRLIIDVPGSKGVKK